MSGAIENLPADAAAGFAYAREHASRRALWSVALDIRPGAGGEAVALRRFHGIGNALVSEERAVVRGDGELREVHACQPHLGEDASARVATEADGARTIAYRLQVDGVTRSRTERVGLPMVTTGSLPLFARAHIEALLAGRTLRARFPVLKVMRSATVTVRARRAGVHVEVAVAPTHPLLRLLFGITMYRFDPGLDTLQGYAGVLDPRDRRRRGRWQEYLGEITLDRPLRLPARTGAGSATERPA